MFDIDKYGNIKVSRANTGEVCIQLVDNVTGDIIVAETGDLLIFSVRYGKSTLVTRKQLTEDNYDPEQQGFVLMLTPEDTDFEPYKYKYDFMFTRADGSQSNFPSDEDVEPPNFQIVDSISRKLVLDIG